MRSRLLRERDAALAVVIEMLRDGVMRCAAGGRIEYVNEAMCLFINGSSLLRVESGTHRDGSGLG